MRIELFYGIRLDDQNSPGLYRELEKQLSSIDMDYVVHFGGGNNDGGLFVGSTVATLENNYCVSDTPFARVASLAAGPATAALRANVDAWWASSAGDTVRDLAALRDSATLELLLVCDSD